MFTRKVYANSDELLLFRLCRLMCGVGFAAPLAGLHNLGCALGLGYAV